MSGACIDLWWFRLGTEGEAGPPDLGLLDTRERIRFRQIGDPSVARFFAFRRTVRRVVLASYLGEPPQQVAIAESPDGKPRLVHPSSDLGFSASHSGISGVIAVAPGMPVGVDLEVVREIDAARFAERILSPAERLENQHSRPADQPGLILRAWTAKEALVKAMGLGLDLAAFRQISVPLTTGLDEWQAAGLGGKLEARGGWQVCTHSLPPALPQPALASIAAPSALPVKLIDAQALLAGHGLR